MIHQILGLLIITVSFSASIGTLCAFLSNWQNNVEAYIYAFIFVHSLVVLGFLVFLGAKIAGGAF